jgi:hypothetical protein
VPYDRNPNQITFTNAGVPTANGVYTYTQTGAPYMFSYTGFVGPLTYATPYHDYRNNFVQIDTFSVEINNFTGYVHGYALGEWYESNYTYFNTGNIPFVNRIEINENLFDVNGVYTRLNSQDDRFDHSNGIHYIIKTQDNTYELRYDDSLIVYQNNDINLDPNNWHTTGGYYPADRTDGLLGIQYSGYFGNDPTWFNTASVKPIINEIVLGGSSESKFNGTYTKTNYGQPDQGVAYYLGDNGNFIYYYAGAPVNESYWYLNNQIDSEFISYNLETWIQNPNGPFGSVPPSTTITQTQNFENSTNFGVGRALSNNTSWQWVGYFRANDTSNHNFYLNADEDAYFWFGDKAVNGYTTGNADIYSTANNGSSIINLPLTSGTYYPVRIQWGHPGTPTQLGLVLSYRNGIQGNTYDFSGLFFNFTGDGIATNSNGVAAYDFTLGEWQSTYTGYNPAPNAVYSHVWLDSISGFVNTGVVYSGNKHVTLVNNPVYSSDYSGVYSFNGVDQYALTQEVPQSVDGSFSNLIWFKPTGAGVIISELGQPEINNYYHDSQMEINEAGEIHFGVYAYNGIITSDPIDFNRWYHLGLTYSSGVLSAYIDGVRIESKNSERYPDLAASLHYGICAPDSTNMGVGGYGQGSVGSFQAYNKGLTTGEVNTLYNNEKDRYAFSDTIYYGEDNGVCDGGVPILATGDGLTFCESNTFTSNDFLGIGDGYIYIRYNGQYKTVNCQAIDNFVTFRDSCSTCP